MARRNQHEITTQDTMRPASLWVLWAWMMVVFAGVSLAGGVAGGVLAPTVLLDIVSFWPLFAIALLVAIVFVPLRRRVPGRLPALVPLLIITTLGVAVGLHIAGWSQLPSSAADITGPPAEGVSEASLTVDLSGRLTLTGSSDALYTVRLDREGGAVGVPEALESLGDPLTIDLREHDGGRWFHTAGWTVQLSPAVVWTLDLASPKLAADTSGLIVKSLRVSGAGSVQVGQTSQVFLDGEFALRVPSGVGVMLIGPAAVPADWLPTDEGWQSPGGETQVEVWVTEGSSVKVEER